MKSTTPFRLAVSLSLFFPAIACAQFCLLGEPAVRNCPSARVIDGSVGQHVVYVDAHNYEFTYNTSCTPPVGHVAWFEVTPVVSGPMTVSTCHPNTAFDTVLEVFEGGDGNCDFMTSVGCVDDSPGVQCSNGCSGQGSEMTIDATAGVRYRFIVGSFGANTGGCTLCLGVVVTIGEPCGDPPYGVACGVATELPGWEGTHAIQIDVEDAPKGQDADFWSCSINVGKQQWLTFTPLVDGIATFSTCSPETTYDTVVRALTGNCAESLLVLDCVDDSLIPSCDTGCDSSGPRGTIAEFPVEAGVPYYVEVGSYNDNASGCDLCLDATLQIESYCTLDPTPPLVEITSPADSECVCGMVPITGTATDPESPLREYRIEYRPLGGNWSLIGSGTGPVSAGSFGEWNTSGLSQGWYVLRLTAANACGLSASVVRIVRLDGYFDTLIIHEPAHATVVGGSVCFDGSASDDCFDQYVVWYRPIGGTFVPVDPSQPIYGSGVLNDALASWDTIGLGLPDGSYELELAGTTICGNGAAQTIFVDIDNTAPTAVITSPMNCDSVDGIVDIVGTAADASLAGWSLSYTGGNTNSWVPIASGTGNISGSTLAQWNTAGLPPCAYTLRLVVEDSAAVNCSGALHHRTEYLTTVAIGWPGDFDWDNDGDVDLVDYQAFEGAFTGP